MAAANLFRSILERTAAAMTLTQHEVKGMTAEKTLQSIVERAAAAVTLRPAIGQGTDTTTVRLRSGTTCDVEEGPWRITADPDPELGGSNENPGPGFLLRAALGTCFAQTVALWAAKFGVSIDRLEVEVEADHDARGLLGVGDAAPRFTELRYRITAESAASKEDVRRVLDAAHAHSPVRGSLEHAFNIKRDVQIMAPASQ